MRGCFLFISCAILMVCFSSCWKDDTPPVVYVGGTGLQLTRIQQGTDPATDTVFKIIYNGNNISRIYDSIFAGSFAFTDALNVFYNGDLLQSVSDLNGGLSATYSYDPAMRLKEIDINFFGEIDNYYYTYTGNNVSQKRWFSDFSKGTKPVLYQTSNYTVTNGNITEAKTYDSLNTLTSDVTFTYNSQPHAALFKQLALLDLGDFLFLNDFEGFGIGGCDTYFNANMMAGYTNGSNNTSFPNTLNANQMPLEIIDKASEYTFTWQFSYW